MSAMQSSVRLQSIWLNREVCCCSTRSLDNSICFSKLGELYIYLSIAVDVSKFVTNLGSQSSGDKTAWHDKAWWQVTLRHCTVSGVHFGNSLFVAVCFLERHKRSFSLQCLFQFNESFIRSKIQFRNQKSLWKDKGNLTPKKPVTSLFGKRLRE